MTHDAHPACRRTCWLTATLAGVAVVALTYLASHAELSAALLLGGLVGIGLGGFLRWAFCAGRIAYVAPEPLAPVAPFAPIKVSFAQTETAVAAPVAKTAAQAVDASARPVSPTPAAVTAAPAQPLVLAASPVATAPETEASAPLRPLRSGPFAPLNEAGPASEPATAPRRRAAKPKAAAQPEKAATKSARAPKAKAGAGATATATDTATASAPARSRAAAKTAGPKPAAPKPPRASGLDFAVNKSKQAVPATAAPEMLAVPRNGKADDLKEIRGVGPVIETLLNRLGFWHFDQIAGWKARDIAYVDERLVGFHGRISRDEWVRQAQMLAAGGTTEHSRAVRRKGSAT